MEQPKKYSESSAFSQSDMKLFEENVYAFYNQKILGSYPEKRSTKSMDLGNIVDALITQSENFDSLYFIYGEVKVPDTIKLICDKTFETLQDWIESELISEEDFITSPVTKYPDLFLKVARNIEMKDAKGNVTIGYHNNYKDDTLTNHVLEASQNYFEELKKGYGKKMVHITEYSLAKEMCGFLREDDFCKVLLDPLFNPSNEITVKTQEVLYGEIEGFKVKGLLDIAIIDHNSMEAYVIDIKASESPSQFKSSYKKFKNYRQGALYTELLRQNFPDYTILYPKFVVCSKDLMFQPEIYEMGENDYLVAMNGGKTHDGFPVKGITQILHEIQWHIDNDKWLHPARYYYRGKYITNIFTKKDA